MTRRIAFTFVATVAAYALMLGCAMGLGATLAHADTGARSVSLDDALSPPSRSAYLYPGARVTYAYGHQGLNCPPNGDADVSGFFTDVSAYRWNGHAMAHAQEWDTDGFIVTLWRDSSGRSVTFDGITFRNHTHHRVIVAGWCE